MVPETVLAAFEMMWDLFPEPVMLVRRDRTILATNALGRDLGIPVGTHCHQLNPDAGTTNCRHCRANEAMKTGKAIVAEAIKAGKSISGYWVPVQGQEDLFLHFGIGMHPLQDPVASI